MKKSDLRKIIKEEISKVLSERVEVVTREFETSHGKKPKGDGNWAFRLESSPRDKDGDIFWPGTGRGAIPFKEALKLAKKEAESEGARYVIVMP